jgi:hypothetical protein
VELGRKQITNASQTLFHVNIEPTVIHLSITRPVHNGKCVKPRLTLWEVEDMGFTGCGVDKKGDLQDSMHFSPSREGMP